MFLVYIYGDKKECETSEILKKVIVSANFGYFHITDDSYENCSPQNRRGDIVIIEGDRIEKVQSENGIVIFKTKSPRRKKILIPSNFISIIDAENSDAAGKLVGDSAKTVTCGLSGKNTVTFSSFENESAVISLQRAVTTLDGAVCEPSEVPISFKTVTSEFTENSKYPLLAAAAVLFLCGTEFSENGLFI